MKLNLTKYLQFLFCILLFNSCAEEADSLISVRTEDIVYISGESIILTGRLISTTEIAADDHGFLISEDENFSAPIEITLGPKLVPGRFFGETKELNLQSNYFVQSFANVNGERLVGNVLTFSTLDIVLDDYEPKNGKGDQVITIRGSNFTQDVKVFFDDVPAEILDITVESVIRVRAPSRRENVFANIVVESQGNKFTFEEQFEYIIGKWEKLEDFPVNRNFYREVFQMQNGNEFVFGLGIVNNDQTPNNQIFHLNTDNDNWQTLSFPGLGTLSSFSDWPYFGNGSPSRVSGASTTVASTSDFWKIENGEFVQLASTPFSFYKAVAFTLGEDLFVFGGIKTNRTISPIVYRYVSSTNEWVNHDAMPLEAISDYTHFKHEGKAYMVDQEGQMYSYDGDTWEFLGLTPFGPGFKGINEVIGNSAFTGLSQNSRVIWEYEILNNKWKQKSIFPGDFGKENAASWVADGKVYVMRNNSAGAVGFIEIWVLDPNAT